MLTLVALSCLGLAAGRAAAQPAIGDDKDAAALAAGKPISGISVTGNRRISREDVLGYLHLKAGDQFSSAVLAQDTRELWTSGFFDDIQVDLDQDEGGVSLRFIVRERPTISAIEFQDNDAVSDDDLAEAIEVKTDSVLSRPALGRAIQKIRDLYAEKGYFLAEAESEVSSEKNNEVKVLFKITEHSQVTVRRITFIGNDHISEDELRAIMFTGQESILAFGSGGPFRQDAFERDMAVISGLYADRGYLTAQVHTPRVMLTPDRSGIELSITIHEGPQYRLRQFRLFERGRDGREVEPLGGRRALRQLVRAQSGDVFNRAALIEDLGYVTTLYRDRGYANVTATPDIDIDRDTKEVDVFVPIVRGPVVYFDRIEIHGNTKTRDKVIRRELEVVEGNKFSETSIERSRRRVTALGYFERVDISTSPGSRPDRMDVHVEVAEKLTGTFQVGAGFSSLEKIIATVQIQQANILGNGQNFSLNGQLSTLRQLLNASLFEPYFLDSDFRFSTSLYNQARFFDDYRQNTTGGSVTWGYPLIQPELTTSLTYTLEHNDIATEITSNFLSSPLQASQTGLRQLPLRNLFNDGLTSSFRPSIVYDARDNRLFPTSGIYLRGSTELSLEEFGADTTFWRNRVTARFYYPLFAGIVLKSNTEFGLITSPDPQGVPIFQRFYLGGILDVRGFPIRSLGPRIPLTTDLDPNSSATANGARFGGNMMFYDNIELEVPVMQAMQIRVVGFVDVGNTWNLERKYCQALTGAARGPTSPCFDFPNDMLNLRTSYGFGVRWFSPMGPLRFEWGFPFSRLPYEKVYDFQFTIGNFF